MYIAILGRQPKLGIAELERVFGSDATRWFSSHTATVETDTLSIERLGGTIKAGRVVLHVPSGNWRHVSEKIMSHYSHTWSGHEGKITLGLSAYGFDVSARDVQRIGIVIKKNIKASGTSLRLIPNTEAALNTATSHHNKLGLAANKVELLIVRSESGSVIVAESTGAQNITALAARDQARPKRDAFVGMLPPKLALMMINLARGAALATSSSEDSAAEAHAPILLDPFCGTGVILQEAALLGMGVYGSDLSEKMIRYTRDNLNWLQESHRIRSDWYIHEGDAMTAHWRQPIDLIASETYLGQPFSAPPSAKKLEEVRGNVNHITTTFLRNIHAQLEPGTSLCLAVPAWRDSSGAITRLPFTGSLTTLGFRPVPFATSKPGDLLYYRENQVVARELLVMTRI